MIIRTQLLSKRFDNVAATSFMLLVFPVVLWFQMCVVIPSFYKMWSFWYNFNLFGTIIVFVNLAGNYAATVLCDTSFKEKPMPRQIGFDWKYCDNCDSPAPPRSWHCKICNICILKMDHHCVFTGCCIGHNNHRYFLMFLFYMLVATSVSVGYDTIFLSSRVDLITFLKALKIFCPPAMLIVNHSIHQTYLLLYFLILFAFVFITIIFTYHVNLALKGKVTRQCKLHAKQYDLGKINNIKIVFGERWYLVWISPFITSKLPSDGIVWRTRDEDGTSIKTE